MKSAAKPAHHTLREKLQRLCDSPVAGEAEAAKLKLKRLLARYDFDTPLEPSGPDLFAGVSVTGKNRKSQLLFTFDIADSDVAGFVQWAMEQAYDVETGIRGGMQRENSIWVEAPADAMPELKRVSETIRAQFIGLWKTLREKADVEPDDRKPFMLGLYDGMMDDPRQPGQALPQRMGLFSKKKKKAKPKPKPTADAKGKKVAHRPGLATHPYTLALELGRQIRFCASLKKTTAALKRGIAGAIAPKAEAG